MCIYIHLIHIIYIVYIQHIPHERFALPHLRFSSGLARQFHKRPLKPSGVSSLCTPGAAQRIAVRHTLDGQAILHQLVSIGIPMKHCNTVNNGSLMGCLPFLLSKAEVRTRKLSYWSDDANWVTTGGIFNIKRNTVNTSCLTLTEVETWKEESTRRNQRRGESTGEKLPTNAFRRPRLNWSRR